jgi:hypothetical protein
MVINLTSDGYESSADLAMVYFAEDKFQWRTVENAVINLWVSQNRKNFERVSLVFLD